jgi:D-glycerate 3-kinase
MPTLNFSNFISQHQLPESYIAEAQQWFFPLAENIVKNQVGCNKTYIVGINGAQGSGKSTLADLLVFLLKEKHNLNTVALSIDDFYFTRQQRLILANTIHPLLATRGVPGTHDIRLAQEVINSLCDETANSVVPRFDKSTDDRVPDEDFEATPAKTDIIILEGWCLGAEAQPDEEILQPVNELEKEEDPDAIWRQYVNQQLRDVYPELFCLIDAWIMLKAPSFECVYQWRLEQENKLRDSRMNTTSGAIMDEKGIKRFIQYYQRITEQLLVTLPEKVDYLFELDEDRKVLNLQTKTRDSEPQRS